MECLKKTTVNQTKPPREPHTSDQSGESSPRDSWCRACAVGFSLCQPQQHTEAIHPVSLAPPLPAASSSPRRVRWQRGWFSGKAAGDANDSDKIMALDLRRFPSARLVTK